MSLIRLNYNRYAFLGALISLAFALGGCSGCSKSGMRNYRDNVTEPPATKQEAVSVQEEAQKPPPGRTVVKMQKENGVFKIPVKINDTEMYFIFDTGAGMISISATEANDLYSRGKLNRKDILGTSNFMDAKGDISEGTIVNLRKVTIGNRTLPDVEAIVVDNISAPLLLGQSALERFGKVSIDYSRNEITFESHDPEDDNEGFLKVTKVVDGDTFHADDGSEEGISVRFIGIDAPESRNNGRKVVAYFGSEAKEFTTSMLSGKSVRLEYDIDRTDQYGRTLAYVYLPDGTFVNAKLVREGYAQVMTVPPNVKYADLFVKLQQEAREHNRGLWGR